MKSIHISMTDLDWDKIECLVDKKKTIMKIIVDLETITNKSKEISDSITNLHRELTGINVEITQKIGKVYLNTIVRSFTD